MSSGLDFSVGVAHKFCSAWGKAGGIPAELNLLAQNKDLMREVLERFRDKDYIINGNADAVLPARYMNGFRKVETHKKNGIIRWNPRQIDFLVDPRQNESEGVSRTVLLQEMLKAPVLNANFLDFLLMRPHLIPESWKKDVRGRTLTTVFWGTLYQCPDPRYSKQQDVRSLFWHSGYWQDGEVALADQSLLDFTYRAPIMKSS